MNGLDVMTWLPTCFAVTSTVKVPDGVTCGVFPPSCVVLQPLTPARIPQHRATTASVPMRPRIDRLRRNAKLSTPSPSIAKNTVPVDLSCIIAIPVGTLVVMVIVTGTGPLQPCATVHGPVTPPTDSTVPGAGPTCTEFASDGSGFLYRKVQVA